MVLTSNNVFMEKLVTRCSQTPWYCVIEEKTTHFFLSMTGFCVSCRFVPSTNSRPNTKIGTHSHEHYKKVMFSEFTENWQVHSMLKMYMNFTRNYDC